MFILLMIKNLRFVSLFLMGSTTAISLMALSTHAGQVYMYKDSQGSTLLTNKKSSDRSLQRVKITYYPDSNIHRYSNWGATEASVRPSFNKNKDAFDHIIKQASSTHGVSEGLIKAVMHTESGFNVNARSPVGAQGLMQLMPATARRFNVSNAYDPQQNIMAGAKYLAWLLKRFNGDQSLALAGYNAGEGNVSKYGGIPPFRETQDYVRRVNSRYQNLYSNGVALSAGSSASIQPSAEISAQSGQSSSQSSSNLGLSQASVKQQRQIIQLSDGTFTYANAVAQ